MDGEHSKRSVLSIRTAKKKTPIAISNKVLVFFPSFYSKLNTSSLIFLSSSLIFLGNEQDKIAYTTRVTPFVIVPRDELDKVSVQLDSSFGIEDGRMSVAYEIGGNNAVISVSDDAFVFAFGGLLDGLLDFFVTGRFLSANHEVDNGNIKSGNTE